MKLIDNFDWFKEINFSHFLTGGDWTADVKLIQIKLLSVLGWRSDTGRAINCLAILYWSGTSGWIQSSYEAEQTLRPALSSAILIWSAAAARNATYLKPWKLAWNNNFVVLSPPSAWYSYTDLVCSAVSGVFRCAGGRLDYQSNAVRRSLAPLPAWLNLNIGRAHKYQWRTAAPAFSPRVPLSPTTQPAKMRRKTEFIFVLNTGQAGRKVQPLR